LYNYRGKTALVTGASSGIGEQFARQLAAKGMNLILVARSEAKLQQIAAELKAAHNIKAEVIAADLSVPDAPEKIYQKTQANGWHVDLLVNNAGFSTFGSFDEQPLDENLALLQVNIHALVRLTHLYLPAMLGRKDVGIINVASVLGFTPTGPMAIYAASKAFVLNFSESLWATYRKRGVRVMALCPGSTSTGFFERMDTHQNMPQMTPAQTVQKALKAFERGAMTYVPGLNNKFFVGSLRLMPRSLVTLIVSRAVGMTTFRK
jgi:uncharacterized protein